MYKANNGEMFFGEYDGIISFFSVLVKENQIPAPSFVTGFTVTAPSERGTGHLKINPVQ